MLWIFLLAFANLSKVPSLVMVYGGYALTGAAAVFLGLVLHEGGHVLAGLLLGMQFEHVIVMGWKLTLTDKGLRFSGRPFSEGGGSAALRPRTTHALRIRRLIVSMAGLVGSFAGLAGGVGLLLLNYNNDLQNFRLVVFGSLFSAACAYQLSISLRTDPQGYHTDAERVVALWRMSSSGKMFLARNVLWIAMATNDDEEAQRIFEELLRDYGNDAGVENLSFLLEKSLTRGWLHLSEQSETLLLACDGEDRLSARSKLAFVYTRHRRSPEKARRFLPARTDYEEHPDQSWFCAATLMAFADGDFQTSLTLANEVLAQENLANDDKRWFELAKQRSEYRLTGIVSEISEETLKATG